MSIIRYFLKAIWSWKWYYAAWVSTGIVIVLFDGALLYLCNLAQQHAPNVAGVAMAWSLVIGIVFPLIVFVWAMMKADQRTMKGKTEQRGLRDEE